MQKLDANALMRDVLTELEDLPEGLEQDVLALVDSAPTSRWEKLRDLFLDVSRD